MVGHNVGVDIGGTKMLMVALGAGELVVQRVPTGRTTRPDDVEAAILRFMESLPGRVDSLGVAVPGLVQDDSEVMACVSLPHLAGWRVRDTLSSVTERISVANDAEAAITEEMHDLAPGSNAAVVMVGTGIGAAFVVDGRIVRGSRGWAGELGGIPIACGDGVYSLGQLASGSAILRRLGLDAAELTRRLASNDPESLRTVRESGMALGLGLSTVIGLFNPGLIALAGGMLECPGYLESALASAERCTMPELWQACSVRKCRAGYLVVALGAARLGMQSVPAPSGLS